MRTKKPGPRRTPAHVHSLWATLPGPLDLALDHTIEAPVEDDDVVAAAAARDRVKILVSRFDSVVAVARVQPVVSAVAYHHVVVIVAVHNVVAVSAAQPVLAAVAL